MVPNARHCTERALRSRELHEGRNGETHLFSKKKGFFRLRKSPAWIVWLHFTFSLVSIILFCKWVSNEEGRGLRYFSDFNRPKSKKHLSLPLSPPLAKSPLPQLIISHRPCDISNLSHFTFMSEVVQKQTLASNLMFQSKKILPRVTSL